MITKSRNFNGCGNKIFLDCENDAYQSINSRNDYRITDVNYNEATGYLTITQNPDVTKITNIGDNSVSSNTYRSHLDSVEYILDYQKFKKSGTNKFETCKNYIVYNQYAESDKKYIYFTYSSNANRWYEISLVEGDEFYDKQTKTKYRYVNGKLVNIVDVKLTKSQARVNDRGTDITITASPSTSKGVVIPLVNEFNAGLMPADDKRKINNINNELVGYIKTINLDKYTAQIQLINLNNEVIATTNIERDTNDFLYSVEAVNNGRRTIEFQMYDKEGPTNTYIIDIEDWFDYTGSETSTIKLEVNDNDVITANLKISNNKLNTLEIDNEGLLNIIKWQDGNPIGFKIGTEVDYDPVHFKDIIYFASDTKNIIINGNKYGIDFNNNDLDLVTKIETTETVGELRITNTNGEVYALSLPLCTEDSIGLMTPEDKKKLNTLANTSISQLTKVFRDGVQGLEITVQDIESSTIRTEFIPFSEVDYTNNGVMAIADKIKLDAIDINVTDIKPFELEDDQFGTRLVYTVRDFRDPDEPVDITKYQEIPHVQDTSAGLMPKEYKIKSDRILSYLQSVNTTLTKDQNSNTITFIEYNPNTDKSGEVLVVFDEVTETEAGLLGAIDKIKLNRIVDYLISIEPETTKTETTQVININRFNPNTNETVVDTVTITEATDEHAGLITSTEHSKLSDIDDYVLDLVDTTNVNTRSVEDGRNINYLKYDSDTKEVTEHSILIPNASETENGLQSSKDKIKSNRITDYTTEISDFKTVDEGIQAEYTNYNPNDDSSSTSFISINKASSKENGVMSKEDKVKLDNITTYPTEFEHAVSDNQGVNIKYQHYKPEDGTTVEDQINISNATIESNGVMSKEDKNRIENIPQNNYSNISLDTSNDNYTIVTEQKDKDTGEITETRLDLPLANMNNRGIIAKEMFNASQNNYIRPEFDQTITRDDITIISNTTKLWTNEDSEQELLTLGSATTDQAGIITADDYLEFTRIPDNIINDVNSKFTDDEYNITAHIRVITDGTDTEKVIEFPLVSHTNRGLMSKEDKIKVDNIGNYTTSIDNFASSELGVSTKVHNYNPNTDENTETVISIPLADQTNNGIMSNFDKIRLDNIPESVQSNVEYNFENDKYQVIYTSVDTENGDIITETIDFPLASNTNRGLLPKETNIALNKEYLTAIKSENLEDKVKVTYTKNNILSNGQDNQVSIDINPVTQELSGVLEPSDKIKIDNTPLLQLNTREIKTNTNNVQIIDHNINISNGDSQDTVYTIPAATKATAGLLTPELYDKMIQIDVDGMVNTIDRIFIEGVEQKPDDLKDVYLDVYNKNTVDTKLKNLNDKTQQDIENLDKEINSRIDQEVADLNETIDNLDTEVSDRIDKEIETINDRIDTEVETLNTTITNTKTEINNRINQEVETINNTINDLDKEINTRIDNEVDTLNQTITNNVNTINERIDNEVSDLNDRIDQEVETINNTITNLDNELSQDITNLKNYTDNTFIPLSQKAQPNGVATLNEYGEVPANQLPSYVDDVIEVYATYDKDEVGDISNVQLYSDAEHLNPITGESGKIYVNVTPNEPNYNFRWSGTQFLYIDTGGLILGEITGTAYDGGKGKYNRDAITSLPNKLVTNVSGYTYTEDTVKINYTTYDKNPSDQYNLGTDITSTITASNTSNAGVMTANDRKLVNQLNKINKVSSITNNGITSDDTNLYLNYTDVNTSEGNTSATSTHKDTIPASTPTTAGVMTAKDRRVMDNLNLIGVVSHMNDENLFISTSTGVTLNYECIYTDGTTKTEATVHNMNIPVVTQTTAGILTASDKIIIDNVEQDLADALTEAKEYTDGEITKVNTSITNLTNKHNTDISTINSTIDDLEAKHDSDIFSLTNKHNSDVTTINNTIDALEDKHDQDVAEINTALDEIRDNITNVEGDYLKRSGGTMTGDITMGTSAQIIATYSGSTDAVNLVSVGADTNYDGVVVASNNAKTQIRGTGDLTHFKNNISYIIFDEANTDPRNLVFNGTTYPVLTTVLGPDTVTWYAPTTAGTNGQILTSTGGIPKWSNQSSLSITMSQISDLGSTWDSYLKAGVYERNLVINGTTYPVLTDVSGATAITGYIPTTAGASGQILSSTGGTPSWINQSALRITTSQVTDLGSYLSNNKYHKDYYHNPVFMDNISCYINTTPLDSGWARVLGFANNPEATEKAHFGAYGGLDTVEYAYIGVAENVSYSAIENLKIYSTNITFGNEPLAVWGDQSTYDTYRLYRRLQNINGTSYSIVGTTTGNLPSIYAPTTMSTNPNHVLTGSSDSIPKWGYPNVVSVQDVRDLGNQNPTPDEVTGRVARFYFSNQSLPSVTGMGQWISKLTVAGWNAGYNVWELAGGSATTLCENLAFRAGINDTWGDWHTIAFQDWTNTQLAGYLPLSGGTLTGALRFNGAALPRATTTDFFLCIDAFNEGGQVKYIAASDVLAAIGGASSGSLNNYLPLSGGTITGNLAVNGTIKTSSGFSPVISRVTTIPGVVSRETIRPYTFVTGTANSPGADPISNLSVDDGWALNFGWTRDHELRLALDVDATGIAYCAVTPSTNANKTGWKFLATTEWVNNNFFRQNRVEIEQEDLNTFVSRPSGTYTVNYTGASAILAVLAKQQGSASALELYSNYPMSDFRVRTAIDDNRYNPWKYFVLSDSGTKNIANYVCINGDSFKPNNMCWGGTTTNGTTKCLAFIDPNDQILFGHTSLPVIIRGGSLQYANGSGVTSTILHTGNIGTITFTGAVSATYNGLRNITVNIPQGGGEADSVAWENVTGKPAFATVATSGSYNDLSDKPSIPSAYTLPIASSDTLGGIKVGAGLSISSAGVLSATGSGVADSVDWDNITSKPSWVDSTSKPTYTWSEISGKPSSFTPSAHTHSASDITSGTLALARIPTGTTSSTVALGNHTHSQYLTSSSLSGYATQSWVNGQIDAITPASIGAASSFHTHSQYLTGISDASGSGTGYLLTNASGSTVYRRAMTSSDVTSALGFTPANSSHTHTFSDIIFNNTGTNRQYLAGDGKFYTVGWSEIGSKPSSFTPSSHTHSASDITSGTLALARIPTGTTSSTVALGNHTHSNYLTSSSLSGYATESYVDDAVANVSIDTSGFVTISTTQTITGAKTFTNSAGVKSSYGFYDTSDIRLKSNIQDIELKDKINLYEFDKGDKHSYGVIAQEIEQIYPSVVQTDEDGYKTVNYNEVLSIKCAELEAENRELKSRLDKLEAILAAKGLLD